MYYTNEAVGHHVYSNGIIKNLDPRVRIISSFSWSLLLTNLDNSELCLIALCISLVLLVLMPHNIKDFFKRLCIVNLFVLFMWCMIPFSFSSPGEVIASFSFFEITKEGLEFMILLSIKINAIMIAFIALMASCPLFLLGQAALKLGVSAKLVSIFLLSVRYIHVMYKEYNSLRNAMRLRAFKFNFSKHGLTMIANLIGSLLIRSIDRAERVHSAMLCRGYTGVLWTQVDFSLSKTDILFSLFMTLTIFILGGMAWLMT